MTDRDKVIKGLELCQQGFDCPSDCPYLDDCDDMMKPMFIELAKDALELLEEYEVKEQISDVIHGLAKQFRRPIVRCEDCKHRPTDPENKGVGQSLVFPDDVCPCQIGDNWYSWMPKDDWFCADGERREEE